MRNPLIALVAVLVVASLIAPAAVAQTAEDTDCEYPLTVTDATGEEVTIDEEPEDVVALYPSDAQTAFDIGAEDAIVGMPIGPYTDSLEAGDRTDISEDDGLTPVTEDIVDLEPDVVLAANVAISEDGLIDQLREEAGLEVYVFDVADSLETVEENARLAGQLTGECESAEETIDDMEERLEAVSEGVDDDRPLVYYAMGGETTPGADTFHDDVIVAAGGENLGTHVGLDGWAEINPETVVDEDPDVIVYPDGFDEPPIAESVEATTAYQNGNVIAVDDNAINQPSPRVVTTVETLATDLEDVGDEAGGEDDADSVPGFAAPAALAAVIAVCGFLTRRR